MDIPVPATPITALTTELTMSSPMSSSTSSLIFTTAATTEAQAAIPTGESVLFNADLKNLKRQVRSFERPLQPEMFRLPATFHSIQENKDSDHGYRHMLAIALWESVMPSSFTYQGQEILIMQLSAPHRPIFLTQQTHGPVVWASTKRALAALIVNLDYLGLTDSGSE
jgi:hypothetical protein